MKTTINPALTNLQGILARLSSLLLPNRALVQQQLQFSNLVNAALSYNYDFRDVRSGPMVSIFLVPALEKILIEHASGMPIKFQSFLLNVPKNLSPFLEAKTIKFRHPEHAVQTVREVTTYNNGHYGKSPTPKVAGLIRSGARSREGDARNKGVVREPFQNVTVLLHSAFAYSMMKQGMEQALASKSAPAIHRAASKVVMKTTTPKQQLGQGLHFFRVLEDVIKASALLSSNERIFNLVPTLYNSAHANKFRDRMGASLQKSQSFGKDVPVSAEEMVPSRSKNPSAEHSRGHAAGSEQELSKAGIIRRKEPRLKTSLQENARRKVSSAGADGLEQTKSARLQRGGPIRSTTARNALQEVARLQHSIGKIIANMASNAPKKGLVKQSVSRLSTASQRKVLTNSQKRDELLSLGHYLTASKDLIGISRSIPPNLELSKKAGNKTRVIETKTKAESPASRLKNSTSMMPVSELLSIVVTSLSEIASPNSQSESDMRLLSPNLHSILLKKLIPQRHLTTVSKTDRPLHAISDNIYSGPPTDVNNNMMKKTEKGVSTHFNSHTSYTKNDLSNSGLLLPLFAWAPVKDIKNVVLHGIRSIYRIQNESGKPTGGPIQEMMVKEGSEDVIPASEGPRHTPNGPHLTERFAATQYLTKGLDKKSPLIKSSKKNNPARLNSGNKSPIGAGDKYMASRLFGLQQTYSGYALNSVMHKTRNTSVPALITANSIQPVPQSLSQQSVLNREGKHLVASSHKKLQDGSIDLPRISQLRAMLSRTYHSIRGPESAASTMGLLSNNQVISSPVYRLPILQSNVESPISWSAGKSDTSSRTRTDSTKSRTVHESHLGNGQSANNVRKDSIAYKELTLRNLRKMIEQIFQEELRRYGL